jgi:hypothetical protein
MGQLAPALVPKTSPPPSPLRAFEIMAADSNMKPVRGNAKPKINGRSKREKRDDDVMNVRILPTT